MNRLTIYALAFALSPAVILGPVNSARAGGNPWHTGSDNDAGGREKPQREAPPSGVYAPKESYVPAMPKPVYPPKREKQSILPVFPGQAVPFRPYGQGGPYGRPYGGYGGAPYGGFGPGYGGYPGNGFFGPMGGPSSGAMPGFGW